MSEQESRPTVVVVALPAADDPIAAASSEQPSAHMTLAFLGNVDDLGARANVTVDDLAANVAQWAGRIDGPITEGVAGTALLGPDKAQVVLVDASAFAQIQDGMVHESFDHPADERPDADEDEMSPIARAWRNTDQYPVWTPHVTLGYTDAPPLAEYTGESIVFDRIALWADDDYREFPLGMQPGEPADDSAQPVEEPVENVTAAATDVLLGEDAPGAPVDERDPADTPQGLVDELDDDEQTVDEALPVPFHGIAAPTGVPSDDRRMFSRQGLSWRKLPLPLTYQIETSPGHYKAVVVGRIDEIWYDETDRIQYQGVFASPSLQPYVDQVIGGIAEGWLRGVSVDVVAPQYTGMYENEQQVVDAVEAGDAVEELMTAGKVAALCVVPIPAFEETYIAIGECDCPDQQVDDEVPADDAISELVASALEGRERWGDDLGVAPLSSLTAAAFRDGLTELIVEDDDVREFASAVAPGTSLEDLDSILSAAFAPGTHDGPGWVTHPKATSRIRNYWVHGKGAAKIKWGAPNDFYRCRHQLVKYVQNPDWLSGLCANMHKEATGTWPGQENGGKRGGVLRKAVTAAAGGELRQAEAWTIVASGVADMLPNRSWFEDPKLTGPTPLTITEDGRVFGHVATWGTCHIGFSGKCVEPPRNSSGYAYFRTGTVKTTDGDVAVGHLTLGTGHADIRQRALAAAAHYDNTGTAAADVAAGDDGIGIWVAGWVRPGTTPEQVYALRAAALSGDWRRIGGRMEMVAALAVNVPGFPIPNTITASALEWEGDEAIVAAGIVEQPLDVVDQVAREAAAAGVASAPDLQALVASAVQRALRAERAFSALNAITRADRASAALAIIGED